MTLSDNAPVATKATTSPVAASSFMQAVSGRRPATTPVWFMRQAGRSLPEYRELRARSQVSMLDACLTPELASEATLQPVRRHGVDAAVFYSDIMVPLRLAGVDVEIVGGVGPVIASPIRCADDVNRLTERGASLSIAPGIEQIRQAVHMTVAQLGSTPLIGFGGAPFTLACYLVAGRPSRDHCEARAFMYSDPESWDRLMTWCADVTGAFIAEQVSAGVSATQLFDSWVGVLGEDDYRRHVSPYSARAIEVAGRALSSTTGTRAPMIHFGTGTPQLLTAMHDAGGDIIGVDQRISLDSASALFDDTVPLQGNLDPAYLTAPFDILEAKVRQIIRQGKAAPSHIFNLAHGVPKDTDPRVLTRLVELVHSL